MKTKQKGFTLLELLVVVSIIGILAALLLANFAGVRGRARDAKRKSEMDSISKALRLYYNDYQSFPDDTNASNNAMACTAPDTCAFGGAFTIDGETYMSRLPLDPMNTDPYIYEYERPGSDSDNFCLTTSLENAGDSAIEESQQRCAVCTIDNTSSDYVVCGN